MLAFTFFFFYAKGFIQHSYCSSIFVEFCLGGEITFVMIYKYRHPETECASSRTEPCSLFLSLPLFEGAFRSIDIYY